MFNATGSMFGLAYGDALGAPTEFLTVAMIEERFGEGGPRELVGVPARVTDDTQMAIAVGWSLWTVAQPEGAGRLTPQTLEPVLRQRFVAWLASPDNNRAPGNTCLVACESLRQGKPWVEASVADSKGCGANMRVTPVGLMPGLDLQDLAGAAQLQAAMTHGHPTALAASELTAYATRLLRDGRDLADVPEALLDRCCERRCSYDEEWLGDLWRRSGDPDAAAFISRGWDECTAALHRLVTAMEHPDRRSDPCLATGEGWIAEETLATALYCALLYADDPVGALARAATTSGDSDSIAAVCGALLGAAYGMSAWPVAWLDRIEYANQLAALGAAWD
ncbi:MAG: ADP-ribosylglycohydrolase family protein [Micromonosporaceae bacterium]|nr:ADP-ribosylglycohydrolase family protein [Micromonosporaceae bacterium]